MGEHMVLETAYVILKDAVSKGALQKFSIGLLSSWGTQKSISKQERPRYLGYAILSKISLDPVILMLQLNRVFGWTLPAS